MSVEKPVFIPGPNCIDTTVCEVLKGCQEAAVINSEIRYESTKRGSSSLEFQLSKSDCQHPQANEARRTGDRIIKGK